MLKADEDQVVVMEEELTLKEYLEEQRRVELEAAEALPWKFDECTSSSVGRTKQNIYICHDCPSSQEGIEPCGHFEGKPHYGGVCYPCAVVCHEFSGADDERTSENGHRVEEIWVRRHFRCDCGRTGRCKLQLKSQAIKRSHNNDDEKMNDYSVAHNFFGKYCYCRGGGWRDGDRTMYQCEICQDWFHDDCVAGKSDRKRAEINIIDVVSEDVKESIAACPDENSFDDFICQECVDKHVKLLASYLKNPKFFTWSRIENIQEDREVVCPFKDAEGTPELKGPLFLVNGWREGLCNCNECKEYFKKEKLLHLMKEEPVYTPEVDQEAKQSLYDLGLKALESHAPREKVAVGIQLIDSLKDRLSRYLETIATENRSVTRTDIEEFFKDAKRPRHH